jgi:hypothetical protein
MQRGPTQLVQQSACRGNSYRRKGAGSHRIDMVGFAISLAYHIKEEGGPLL